MSAWVLMYLFVIVDQVREAVSGYGGAFLIASVSTVLFALIFVFTRMSIDIETHNVKDFDERWEKFKSGKWINSLRRLLYVIWLIPFMMFFVHTALPTQKNLAILIGAGATYEAVTSDTGKRIGGKIIQLLEEKLDEAAKSEDNVKSPVKDLEGLNNGAQEGVKKPQISHAT